MTVTILRPSQAARWTQCAAAPSFEARLMPKPDSDAAREGTAAAWVADCVLKGDAASAEDLLGRNAPNGWLVTLDMVGHVQGYIDKIRSFGGMTTTERFVRLTDHIAGTLDASTALSSVRVLYITDLKYGFEIVDVFENIQLIIYGSAELLRLLREGAQIDRIELGIYQPRAFHPDGIYRTYTLTGEQLIAAANWIIERGNNALAPDPVATPGKHCQKTYCPASGSCVALAHSVYAGFRPVEDIRQGHLSAVELGKELEFLAAMDAMFSARKTAIREEGETRLRSGEHIPGWAVKPTYGHRKFKYDPAVVQWLTGMSPIAPTNMTPAAFERAGADVKAVAELTETPVVGHKLQPVSARDFRKAFTPKG